MQMRCAQHPRRRNIATASPFAIGDALAAAGTTPFTLAPASTPALQTNSGTVSTKRTGRLTTTSGLERSHALAR